MNYSDIKRDLVLNKMTKAQYEALLASGQISDTELYYITDDNDRYYTKQETTQLIQASVPVIEANPEVPDNAALLTSITIGSTDYKLGGVSTGGGGGSTVIANPDGITGEEPTLEAVTIDDVNYLVAAGEMTFSEERVSGQKELRSIIMNDDIWSVERGSIVKPNVQLNGSEPIIESIQIDDAKFTLKGEEMIFSEDAVEGATPLKNIRINGEDWAILGGSGDGGSADLTGYATESYVNKKFEALKGEVSENFDTLHEVEVAINTNTGSIEGLNSLITDLNNNKIDKTSVYTKTEIDNKGFLTQHQSLVDYAKKTDIPSLDGYAKLTDIPSHEGLATETWVNTQGFLKEHQSLDGYATEAWVEGKNYLTEHQSLAGYAKETYVDTKVADLVNSAPGTLDTLGEIATALETHKDSYDALLETVGNKADKSELFSKSYNDLTDKPTLFSGDYNDLTNKPTIPSLDGYATESYVNTAVSTKADKTEIVTSYNDLTDKPTIPSFTYSEEVPEDTTEMNEGDIILVPSAGDSSGSSGAEYEMVSLFDSTDGDSLTTESKSFTSSNVLYWVVGLGNNRWEAFIDKAFQITFMPGVSNQYCGSSNLMTTVSDTTLTFPVQTGTTSGSNPSKLYYVWAFRKK